MRKRINARLKLISIALEPPIDADSTHLDAEFWKKMKSALAVLASQGRPFKLVEGFRTVDRQQWLYGSGRPSAKPYGRPGAILTNADGVKSLSAHQGDGSPGSGKAADCYPMRNGSVYIPPATDLVWERYADAVEKEGLRAGLRFQSFPDAPHCELS